MSRLARAHEIENQRAQHKTWGTEAEEYSLSELFRYFCGMALFLSVAAVVASRAIDALRTSGVL